MRWILLLLVLVIGPMAGTTLPAQDLAVATAQPFEEWRTGLLDECVEQIFGPEGLWPIATRELTGAALGLAALALSWVLAREAEKQSPT